MFRLSFLCTLIFCLIYTRGYSAEVITLKPSLTLQMYQNTLQEKQVKKEAKLRSVRTRAETVRKVNQSIVRTSAYQKIQSSLMPTAHPPLRTTLSVNTLASESPVVLSITQESIPWVDMNRVRSTWLSWYNDTRSSLGLGLYSYDSRLDVTAHAWNIEFAALKWQNHHRRHPGDRYYDFDVIDSWFKARGIDPVVINHAKHVENVGYGYYSCSQSDCTDALIKSIESTYRFFMSERGKSYDAHYRSIIQSNFSRIGLDIITVPEDHRYYITIHYITE